MATRKTADVAKPEKQSVFTVSLDKSFTGLNVREKPTMDSDIVAVIPDGAKVKSDTTKKAKSGWIAVYGGGYVLSEYLK